MISVSFGALLCVAVTAAEPAPTEGLLARAQESLQQAATAPADTAPALYAEAAAAFTALGAQGAESVALRRNEGNAYLLAGNVPAAILAYRQGLQLAPQDRGLRAGLAAARSQVVYASAREFGRPGNELPAWLPLPGRAAQFTLGLAFYCLGCLAATCWWTTQRTGLIWSAMVCWVVGVLFGAALFMGRLEARRDQEKPVAVIAVDNVLLRRGNGEAYPADYETPLNQGVEARVRFTRGEWVQIELAGGEVGWAPRTSVLGPAVK